ncbi:MAG: hypothetical protein AABX11_01235 [Nanoarchaeota archaeon]
MDLNEQIAGKIEVLRVSYRRKTVAVELTWKGYKQEVDGLKGIVEGEFRKVSREVLNGTGVSLGNVNLQYQDNPSGRRRMNPFDILLVGGEIVRGGETRLIGIEGCCAYKIFNLLRDYSEQDSRVNDFKKRYGVLNILCECDCGSDHK